MVYEQDLLSRFTFHPPKEDQSERYDQIRGGARLFAGLLVDLAPASRERDLAVERLDEAVFWALAAIARNE